MNAMLYKGHVCPACERKQEKHHSMRPSVPLEHWCACCDRPMIGFTFLSDSGASYTVIGIDDDYVMVRRIDRGHSSCSRWHIESLYCTLAAGGRQIEAAHEWTVEEILAREG